MLNCEADNLRNEVKAAEELAKRHLSFHEQHVSQYIGKQYDIARQPNRPSAENHAYELMSLMIPALAYDNPKVKLRSADPYVHSSIPIDGAFMTVQERTAQLQAALNYWSVADSLGDIFVDAAFDFMFLWTVLLVTMDTKPGWQGYDNAPVRPVVMKIEPEHFILDPRARNAEATRLNGPRFIGHKWKADREDLLNDPNYDQEQVRLLANDTDVDRYDPKGSQAVDPPTRDEIVCWDLWVPEKDIRMDVDTGVDPDDPAYNGTIYTIAVNATSQGLTKRTYHIRPPTPAFCPPWGPYSMFGYMRVPGSPYPLSPIVATAEQAEEANAHAVAAAEDARNFKRFGVYKNINSADGNRLKRVRHGQMVGLDETEGVSDMEIGGVSEVQYKYNEYIRERLSRVSGIQQSRSGNPDTGVTATAESIANQGFQSRTEGIKSAFRKGIVKVFKTAAWYAHYGEGVVMSFGPEDDNSPYLGEFYGGILPGMEDFTYERVVGSLEIEPYSLGHTDEAMLQRRILAYIKEIKEVAGLMPQTPWVNWKYHFDQLMQSLNLGEAADGFNFEVLSAIQQQQLMAVLNPMGMAGPDGMPMQEQVRPDVMQGMAEHAADLSAGHRV